MIVWVTFCMEIKSYILLTYKSSVDMKLLFSTVNDSYVSACVFIDDNDGGRR